MPATFDGATKETHKTIKGSRRILGPQQPYVIAPSVEILKSSNDGTVEHTLNVTPLLGNY